MKTRRWILFIALFVTFTALVIYHGWNLFEANERIKNYLLTKIRPVLGENCDIEELEVSIGAVHLKGVELRFSNSNYNLSVDDLRVGFSLYSLVSSGFRPQRIPHDILFIRPHLKIHQLPSSNLTPQFPDSALLKNAPDEYWEKVKNFDFIKRITISKGKITLIDTTNQEVLLAHEIDGWLSSKDVGYASARLVGKLFTSNSSNLMMTGNIDLIQGRLDLLNVKLINYRWKDRLPLFIPDYYNIKKGTINGTISLSERKIGRSGFDIWGNVSIDNGDIELINNNLYFENINIDAEIKDWDCLLEKADFILNGSPIKLKGKIKNILKPRLFLEMNSTEFNVQQFSEKIAPSSPVRLKGNALLNLSIENTFENPAIAGQIQSPAIQLNKRFIRNFKTDLTFQDTVFHVYNTAGIFENNKINANLKIDFTKNMNNIQFNINARGKFFNGLISQPFQQLKESNTILFISGKGNTRNILGNVQFDVDKIADIDTSFQFLGDFDWRKESLGLNFHSTTHQVKGTAIVDRRAKKPLYSIKFSNVHDVLYNFHEVEKLHQIFNFKKTDLNIDGRSGTWSLNSDLVWNGSKDNSPRTAKLICKINKDANKQLFNTNVKINSGEKNYTINLNAIKTQDFIQIKNFDITNLLFSNGRIDLDDQKKIEANIIFPDASLTDLRSLIFNNTKVVDNGKIFGSIGIGGTLNNIILSGKFDFIDVVLNSVGYYKGTTSFQYVNDRFQLDDLKIKRNDKLILVSNGSYSISPDQMNFDILCKSIDLNALLSATINKPGWFSGNLGGEIKLRGGLKSPKFFGLVDVDSGRIGRFNFDKVKIDLGHEISISNNGTKDSSGKVENGIQFSNILLERSGQFEMVGFGDIPYASTDSMNIMLNGKGNFLSILPEITPFFMETRSNGEWTIHLTGRPTNLIVEDVNIKLADGYMHLGNVAREIKDIVLELDLEQDGFLDVKSMSGRIGRRTFNFANMMESPYINGRKLEPFLIPELGLNLGIFTVETDPKGVPLYIPGFMEKGEIGHFMLRGKSPKEKFYIAGPVEEPEVVGEVVLQNVNFTFPFIVDEDANNKDNVVVNVLKMIDWDIHAVAGKDLHYQRQIPSGLDNVYVDLIVDAGLGGLNFNGVLDDKTFGVTGELSSSRGTVEYLDLDFQVTKSGVEFDLDVSKDAEVEFDKTSLLPIIYGEARTTVTDSTGFPYYIYLTLLTIDKNTGHKLKKGRLGEMIFELSTENRNLGDTEGDILAALGYSTEKIREKATDLIGISTDNLVFRPLFRPFERRLERTLGLDMVRFSSRFTRNLIEMNLKDERNFQFDSKLFLLRSTKLMLGKYLADRLFLLYTGQLEAGLDYRYQHEGFGLRHTFGLEFRVNPSLLLQMEYDYNSLLLWQKEDKKILLRHSFPF